MLGDLIARWADQLVSVCWQTALLALLVWVVTRVFRKLSPTVKTWLWWLVMLKAVVGMAVVTPINVPLLPSTDSPFAAINDRMDLLAPRIHASPSYPVLNTARAGTGAEAVVQKETSSDFPWLLAVLALIWAGGVLAQCGFWIRDVVRLRRWVREAAPLNASPIGELTREIGISMRLHAPPRIAESEEITAPMVVGPWHPVVLLPMGMAEELSQLEMRMVIAHELAHLRRKDLALAVVPAMAQALLFFWPTNWLAEKEWSIEREVACDTEAIGATQVDPNRYGRLLLKIVTSDHRGGLSPALGATASYHTLRKRLTMMKETIVRPSRGLRAAGIALCTFGMLLVFPWQVSARGAEDNEVKNAGFESGLQSWGQSSMPPNADTGVAVEIDHSTFHSGSASLKFTKSANRFFPVAVLNQAINVPSGAKRIKVDMWVKAEDAKKATLAVIMNGGGQDGKIEWGAYVGIANDSDKPANHDWKKYGAVVAVPDGTDSVIISLQMYGPGTVWFDDVSVAYVPESTPLKAAVASSGNDDDDLADIKDVSNEDLRAGSDPSKRYFLIGADKKDIPAAGYKLLIVLPGGDGSADFNPFIRRVKKNALPKDYIVAELVAPKWSDDQAQQLVWPTRKVRWQGMKFSTEDFVEAVVKDIKSRVKIDDAHVYDLAWSSGGPAAYAISLSGGPVKGSFIAMSVYKPSDLGPPSGARGHAYYLLHSPEDFIKMSMPQAALKDMQAAGARAVLKTYEGGHGWHGDIFGQIRDGVDWLEKGS